MNKEKSGEGSLAVNYRINSLMVVIGMLLLISTLVIQYIENIAFHDALYFVVVSLSTVGFGDISPCSVLGKVSIIAFGDSMSN